MNLFELILLALSLGRGGRKARREAKNANK